MRNIAVLTVVALAALVVVMAHAGPAYAAQSAVAVSNSGTAVDTVVGTESTVPAQLVGRGHRGGGVAFRSGSGLVRQCFRSFRGARFRNFTRWAPSFHSGHSCSVRLLSLTLTAVTIITATGTAISGCALMTTSIDL